MAGASFVQTDFLGGEWSPAARGHMDDPQYKTAMQASLNGFPLRNKAWTRRPGFIFMGNSRRGQKARIMTFAFSQSNPFEIEFTAGFARFYSATGAVFTPDIVPLVSISTANPAVVTVAAVPSTWSNGDEIQFNFTLPLSADVLSGRRFIIASKTATTFTISDALTGAGIDGSTFTYTPNPTGARDSVLKVLELAVPYGPNDFDQIRIVQNDTTALILHPNYQPQALVATSNSFTITAQAFSDGPYLNINTTATTLAPSATTGSVTITASSPVGINGGAGFVGTDIGRLVRLQSAPAAWAAGTAYNKGATVLGSDNNIYTAQAKSTGVDPTTDNGVNWLLSGQTVVWSWATITAVNSITSVTATINGPALSSTAATTSWQLGLYSNTTGWPIVGVYHEGRFWLAGSTAVFNRIDGSVSNDVFNFSPTAKDGTVGDSNAVAVISNADTQNQLVWLLTAQEGILAGTVSGEWLIRSSQFGDPITPTSIQIRRVSTYGCAPVEPQIASLTTVFVQKQQRKLMDFDHYPYGETAGWFANDISLLADHLTASGIAELRWQQEPNHILWARKTDGTLAGTVFQHGPSGFQSANIYNGWHRLSLGGNRTVVSIATGPTANGLSTTLYLVALNATTGYYELLALDSIPDDGTAIGDRIYVDGVAAVSAIQNLSVATGAAIDGVRLQGLWNANGQTVSVVFGGLDLGDFVVANGRVDIPYSGSFTAAFVSALSPPVSSIHALPVQPVSNGAVYASNGVGAYVPNTANFGSAAGFDPGIDVKNRRLVTVETAGFRLFDLDKFTEIVNNTPAQVFGPGSSYTMVATVRMYHPALNSVFMQIGSGNQGTLGRISVDKTGFKLTGVFGILGNSFTSDSTHLPSVLNSMIPLDTSFLAAVGSAGILTANTVTVLNGATMGWLGAFSLSDSQAFLAPGPSGQNIFYVLGTPNYGSSPSPTAVSLYKATYSPTLSLAAPVVQTLIGTIGPSTIDSTWTNFSAVTGPMFDPVSGGLLVFFSTTDAVTNKNYWVLFNPNATTIAWKTAVTYTVPFTAQAMGNTDISGGHLYFRASGNITDLTVATGAIAVTTFNNFLTGTGIEVSLGDRRGVIVGAVNSAFATPLPVFLGPQSGDLSAQFALLLGGTSPASNTFWPPPSLSLIPASVGVTYTSQGQIMPPDFQRDAGAINGPAFGKIRRLHWFGVNVDKSMAFSIGINFTDMFNVAMTDYQLNPVIAPATFTGTISDTIQADYDFDSAIAWQVTRPTPLTITAISGYIESVDK